MTARTPKRMIRTPEAPIRGTRPPPRQVPGGGIPPGAATPPRPVEGGGLLPAVPLPPLPARAGQVAVGALPTVAAAPLGRMKNSELRGKIAKLERDNRILAEQVVELTRQLQEALK